MIYKRGAVQIKASYAKIKGIDRKMFVLNKNILTKVYRSTWKYYRIFK